MKRFFLENWIILVIGVSLVASMSLAIRNNYVIEENHALQQQTQRIRSLTQNILSTTMHGLDLGVRGYALTKDNNMLRPYEEAIQTTPAIFRRLDSLLQKQEYENRSELTAVDEEVRKYIKSSQEMIGMAQRDSMRQFTDMLRQDKGYDVWKKYSAFSTPLFAREDELNKQAITTYRAAMRNNLILQVSILLLTMPLLYLFIVKMRRERDRRSSLLKKVDDNDRQYVFNSGEDVKDTSTEINETSIHNVKKASNFISSLTEGNYQVEWDGLTDRNKKLNESTLAGNLLGLRDKLKRVKVEDERRNWINEGLAAFSEIVRSHQTNMEMLCEQSINYMVRYLNAQQAGLFVMHEEGEDRYLTLASCYAFNRKKYIEKRINIGEGLVGQTYLEGDTVRLKKVPQGYTHITSGLGEATPKFLAIVPFKYDRKIPAIIEISSFSDLEEHQLQFLERAGEHLASAIVSSQNTVRMRELLESASQNEEQMRQREEELRQNMEELQATQEQLMRQQREANALQMAS
ncbi:MAG: CHASE3 domain-containing protein [Chryseolinea sp.]